MHLISGITDESPRPLVKLNVKTGPLRSFHFGIYYSFGLSRLFFFAFFGVFSGDFGFLYSCSVPDLLLFLNYFLSLPEHNSPIFANCLTLSFFSRNNG